VDPRVVQQMVPYLYELFGNPASRSHAYGWAAEEAVEIAREQVAALIGADPREIVWTSGATESNNLAIKGVARFHQAKGRHLDHAEDRAQGGARHRCANSNAKASRSACSTCRPTACWTWRAEGRAAARHDLVSVMLVNNEIGVIQDMAAIGALCRARRAVARRRGAGQRQGGHRPGTLPVDLMSLSAHKTYGPKGVGALYVRRKPRVRIEAQMHGGGHERGMRSGTLPTHQIVGMGEAYRLRAREHGRRERTHPRRCATACWPGCRHPRDARQRQPRAARAAQPERQLPVRRRRVAADGHEGHRRVVGLGLHLAPAWSPATCCARWACPTRSRTARSASRSAASPRPRTSTPRSSRSAPPSSGCAS
jgi:hypothetical protein